MFKCKFAGGIAYEFPACHVGKACKHQIAGSHLPECGAVNGQTFEPVKQQDFPRSPEDGQCLLCDGNGYGLDGKKCQGCLGTGGY